MDLRQFDLNLLVVFNQLLQDRRVSSTADKLGLSQPAVSHALKRLRLLLKDELFIRTSRGMDPTPYALHLGEHIGQALASLQNALSQRDSFDPSTSERTFTLSLTDIGEIYFMPTLMEKLSLVAPHIKISTLRNTSGSLSQDMASGNVDLAVGLLPSLTTGFFQRRLFKQRYVCMFCPSASRKNARALFNYKPRLCLSKSPTSPSNCFGTQGTTENPLTSGSGSNWWICSASERQNPIGRIG